MNVKEAYLTIDDGPSDYFIEIVDFLEKNKIPTIFFCRGDKLLEKKDEAIYAIKKGFVIGSHSYQHRYFSDMNIEECRFSIKRADEIIDSIYKKADVHRNRKFFRFPHFDTGGDRNGKFYEYKWSRPENEWFKYEFNNKRQANQDYLEELGYRQPKFGGINIPFVINNKLLEGIDVRCTFDQMEYFLYEKDTRYSTEEAILKRIDEDYPDAGRALNCLDTRDIILIHDFNETKDMFFKCLNMYIEKGIRFVEAK